MTDNTAKTYYIPGAASTDTTDLNEDEKARIQGRDYEVNNLIAMYDKIASKLSAEERELAIGKTENNPPGITFDIDLSNQIAGCISTIFSAMRKESNKAGSAAELLNKEVKIGGTLLQIRDLYTEMTPALSPGSFAVATPIMNTFTAHKLFFDEVHVGVTKFVIRADLAQKRGIKRNASGAPVKSKKDDPSRLSGITTYGLNTQHIPLLQGITLPPERKTGLAKSVGPLTQAITLVNETNFKNKTVSALEHSLAMLDIAPGVIGCLSDATEPGQVAGVLGDLGNLLLLTTARSTQKIYLPFVMFRYMWRNRGANFQWNLASPDVLALYTRTVILDNIRFRMRSRGTADKLSQAVFHASFGTYVDDISILKSITNRGDWVKRGKMADVFNERSTAEPVTFQPITFRFVSKLAQTLQTKSLGNVQECLFSRPTFSGFTARTISQKMKDYLNSGTSGTQYSKDPSTLRAALREKKDMIMKALGNKEVENIGTRKWYEIKDNELIPVNARIPTEGISFF